MLENAAQLGRNAFPENGKSQGTLTANGAKYLAKYLHDKYVCPVTEILLSELMEAVAKRSVHSPFLLQPPPPRAAARHREYRGESLECE
ncbi:hypothetical protein ALC56_10713 [Trachymyrmex septentrionalis]|uniref:Uncharacterized protein n=1 Tax=Trachymyrmex septentrionalis TaxID=34720 RepID=A0A195F3M4_9HYME|nr:hypothetical protein ALC56_10713 [Trachymyrmex septentrionalis]